MSTETETKTGYDKLSMEDAAEIKTIIEIYGNAANELRGKLYAIYPDAKQTEFKPHIKTIGNWLDSVNPPSDVCRKEVKAIAFSLYFIEPWLNKIMAVMEKIESNISGDSIDYDDV